MISKKEVEHVAKLACLALTEDEKELYSKQLSSILDFVGKLNELDVKDIEPTYHVLPLKNVLRDDVLKDSLPQDVVLSNAPLKEKGHFKVPRIIE
ncbi:MAG: Asp-tRNA(Asn)/Glu-tRNA(Gln) amidotransferase subunit GatC [Candidatus Firestonebacteria bacterium]